MWTIAVRRRRGTIAHAMLFVLALAWPASTSAQQTRGVVRANGADGVRRAVVVGVSQYPNLPPDRQLQFAAADARLIWAFLRSPAGGALPNDRVRLLLDSTATAGRIRDALRWLEESSSPGDQAIIYFAGHGDVEEATKEEGGYLLASNAPVGRNYNSGGAIAVRELQTFANRAAARGVRVLLITDACRSGTLAGTPAGAALTTAALLREWASTIKLVSSQPDQVSYEGIRWGDGHGVFTYFLVTGLLGGAQAESDGRILPYQVHNYLLQHVPTATSGRQVPGLVGNATGTQMAVLAPASAELVWASAAPESPSALARFGIAAPDRLSGDVRGALVRLDSAIQRGRLDRPAGQSAWDIYQQMARLPGAEPVRRNAASVLAAALEDDAQRVINAYLAGGNAQPSPAEFRAAAAKLAHGMALLGDDVTAKHVQAMRLFLEGYALSKSGRPSAAIPLLRQSLAIEEAAYALNGIGSAYLNSGQPDSAEAVLLRVVQLRPFWAFPFNNLGVLYHYLGRFDAAIVALNRAIAIDSTYARAHFNLGRTLFRLGRVAEAGSAWRTAMRLSPEDASDLIARYFEGEERNIKQADSVYRRALELRPVSPITMVRLGDLYKRAGRLDEAEREYLRATATDSLFALAFSGLGALYEERFRPGGDSAMLVRAVTAFRRATALAPLEPVFHRNLGIIYTRQRRFDDAGASLSQAVALDSLDPVTYHAVGALERERGRLRLAEPAYRRAIDLDPMNVQPYFGLADVSERLGEPANAEQTYKSAARNFPDSASVAVASGDFYLRQKRLADAERQYRHALELDPKSQGARNGLEQVKARIGRPGPREE